VTVVLQTSTDVAVPGGYGVALLQTLLALAAVCILAWVVLRWGARRGFGVGLGGGRVRVLERVALDPRRAIYLVQVADKVLLIGAGDGAAPAVLAELDPSELPPEPERSASTFRDVLARLGAKRDG
jgi:flagellar biosynthetic protein FliO